MDAPRSSRAVQRRPVGRLRGEVRVGDQFENWRVLIGLWTPDEPREVRVWRVQCVCGTQRGLTEGALLSRRYPVSCGCAPPRYDNALFSIYRGMVQRCTGDAHPDYGGRGIRVCARWRNSFDAFVDDMGPRPSKRHSLERMDNSGHYEPGNVKWGLPKEQNANRRTREQVKADREAWKRRRGM